MCDDKMVAVSTTTTGEVVDLKRIQPFLEQVFSKLFRILKSSSSQISAGDRYDKTKRESIDDF